MSTKNIEITKVEITKVETEADSYTKDQILSAKKYIHRKDVLNVVLENHKSYTLEEVDGLIDDFMKSEVK